MRGKRASAAESIVRGGRELFPVNVHPRYRRETNAHSALLFHDVSIVMLTGAERLDEPQDGGEPTNDPEQRPRNDDPQAD